MFTAPTGWGAADAIGDSRSPVPGAITGVNQLIGTITNLQAANPADFIEKPTKEQLAEYDLNDGNPNAIRVEITNKDNEKLVAFIGKKDAAAPATPPIPGSPPSNKVWVRVEGQPGVIRATAGDTHRLSRHRQSDPLRTPLASTSRASTASISAATPNGKPAAAGVEATARRRPPNRRRPISRWSIDYSTRSRNAERARGSRPRMTRNSHPTSCRWN